MKATSDGNGFEPWSNVDRSKPHAFLQHKGSSICADIYCECGFHSHIDSDFVYYVACPACPRKYEVSSLLQLKEVKKEDFQGSGFSPNYWDHCIEYATK